MSKKSFFGLSLDQRLTQSNLTQSFSSAKQTRNAHQMTKILNNLNYSEQASQAMTKTFLNK